MAVIKSLKASIRLFLNFYIIFALIVVFIFYALDRLSNDFYQGEN